jgi:catechol 2,3-dioxygenase-like lactoylglutathione lyase family enzyme
MRPKTDGILETSLYVSDVPRSVRFYEETFGFRVIIEFGARGCAMHAGPHQVLLLFKKGASRAMQSPHDGDGELHVVSLFLLTNGPTGNRGSKREELPWKKSGSGNWEAGASTFETPTVI